MEATTRYLSAIRGAALTGGRIGGPSEVAAASSLLAVIGDLDDAETAWPHRTPLASAVAAYAAALAGPSDAQPPTVATAAGLDRRQTASEAAGWCLRAWLELADVAARRATRSPTICGLAEHADSRGPVFAFDGANGDNPEPWWYHELVALHAMTSYGHLTGDAAVAGAARRSAAYHDAETQPDHATAQPWAVHAFLAEPAYLPTADLLLLAAGVGRRGALDPLSRLLLADAFIWLSGGPAKAAGLDA